MLNGLIGPKLVNMHYKHNCMQLNRLKSVTTVDVNPEIIVKLNKYLDP